MRRCARPGCPVEAAWAVGFDPVARVAWLTALDGAAPIVLCAAHADTLRLPRGWAGLDQRDDASALWLAVEPGGRPVPRRRRRGRVSRAVLPADTLPFSPPDHDPAGHIRNSLYGLPAAATEDTASPFAPAAAAATAPAGARPPLGEHADGPLLTRAFRAAGLG